ncbi:hypothetical protein LEN26_017242 [Aphanomyces euteiches]|nr:hypothetical protein LEN26_017242 [Aphanomyces euteiches]KAH9127037.1 hypothetical protein AeMF1_002605 [Aphanomyces euteiches]KAH9183383.1 hypothetical protein AeNC1_014643 [Aphanomyces euteiches]
MVTHAYEVLLDIIARLRDQLRATARAVLALVHENQQLEQQVHTLKGQLDKAQEEIQHAAMEIEIWNKFRDGSNQEIATAHIHALETQALLDRAASHAKEQSLLDRIQVLQMELHISKAKPADSSVPPNSIDSTNTTQTPSRGRPSGIPDTRHGREPPPNGQQDNPRRLVPSDRRNLFMASMFAVTHVTASHKQEMNAIPPHKTYPEDTPVMARVDQAHVSPAETWLDRIRRWVGVLQKTWRFRLLFP